MKFVFDLDGTITKSETLPLIAGHFGVEDRINDLTENTIKGNIPFVESFIRRVGILGDYSVTAIRDLLAEIEVFSRVSEFIANNAADCVIATGNLDIWVTKLAERFNCKVYCSSALLEGDKVSKLTNILKKEEIVTSLQASGETVVYIGDGNNDAEAMRLADYSIACGLVHRPARSVLSVADFAVFDEDALVRLLLAMKATPDGTQDSTLVLSCAGIGSRLGLNSTKALIEFDGRPHIHWQLDSFAAVEDLRIVVGFQADDVMNAVLQRRRDVLFVFNHEYFSSGTGQSLYLGSRFARNFVIAWDGDLIVHRRDIQHCLTSVDEYLGVSDAVTDDAVYAHLSDDRKDVMSFSRTEKTPFEWSGPAKLRSSRISAMQGNVFEGLLSHLPLPAKHIDAFDIDTPNDYAHAIRQFRSYHDGE